MKDSLHEVWVDHNHKILDDSIPTLPRLYKVTLPLLFRGTSPVDVSNQITKMLKKARKDSQFPCERCAGSLDETPWFSYEDWIEATAIPKES